MSVEIVVFEHFESATASFKFIVEHVHLKGRDTLLREIDRCLIHWHSVKYGRGLAEYEAQIQALSELVSACQFWIEKRWNVPKRLDISLLTKRKRAIDALCQSAFDKKMNSYKLTRKLICNIKREKREGPGWWQRN